MRIPIAALMACAVAFAPAAAIAGDRDDARVMIAAAKAKLDLNEKSGVTGEAAAIQGRGRMALDKAQKAFRKSKEDTAQAAAREADALAEQAAAAQQAQTVEGQTAVIVQQPQ
jgi:hypothetical protein